MNGAKDTHGNILLIRLKSIGDILFTLPAVHAVRENFPGAKISFLVSKEFSPLLEGFRDVNEVMALDRAPYHRKNPKAMLVETFSLLRRLRRGKFSLVMDFQGYGETAWMTRLSGAPRRWGCVYQSPRSWAYTQRVRHERHVHPVEGNLSLLAAGGLPRKPVRNEFVLPDAALAEARRFFAAQGMDAARPALFIQPFTSSPHKNWPLENYLALARQAQEQGLQVLFGGGPAERAALEPARSAGFPVAAGVPLLVAAGLMKLSSLVAGADTGLLHLAVAMQKRVVMLMIWPAKNHPFQHADWVVTPAKDGAISDIGTGAVIAACMQALAEPAPGGASG
jgi:ADP-heptose:LPS heptosyltransferase